MQWDVRTIETLFPPGTPMLATKGRVPVPLTIVALLKRQSSRVNPAGKFMRCALACGVKRESDGRLNGLRRPVELAVYSIEPARLVRPRHEPAASQ